MGWCTTFDLEQFAAAAGGYLRSRAAENTLLLSAAQAAGAERTAATGWRAQTGARPPGQADPGVLFGWWEPPGGGEPRGAFVHDPAAPLLISGRAPEMAAALAVTLAKMGRQVFGVDAPTEAADAFAAAWSQRAGTTVRAHRNCRVYRIAGGPRGGPSRETPAQRTYTRATPPNGAPALPGSGGWPSASGWSTPEAPGPVGRLRVVTAEDKGQLAGWLTAFATEAAERIGSPADLAADLISYGGAVFWEVPLPPAPFRDTGFKDTAFRDTAHPQAVPRLRDARFGEPAFELVALATLTRPVAGIARISMLYTPPDRRRNGYSTALTLAVSRAIVAGPGAPGAPRHARGVLGDMSGHVDEVVMITDKNRSDRWGGRLGYQLVSERAVLRFGPVTGPMPRSQPSGAMPRLPTGPLPRLPRLHR